MRNIMNVNFRNIILLLTVLLFSSNVYAENQKLSILLYPWVPDYDHISSVIETEFENQNPTIDLIISEQNWDYYDQGGLDKQYDVYELDTIFLPDFIAKSRVQALDVYKLDNKFNESFDFAIEGSKWGDSVYGVPHWVCGLFLFYFSHDKEVASSQNKEVTN